MSSRSSSRSKSRRRRSRNKSSSSERSSSSSSSDSSRRSRSRGRSSATKNKRKKKKRGSRSGSNSDSRSYSSSSSSSRSRSISIPRRKGSPSFLERRRITRYDAWFLSPPPHRVRTSSAEFSAPRLLRPCFGGPKVERYLLSVQLELVAGGSSMFVTLCILYRCDAFVMCGHGGVILVRGV